MIAEITQKYMDDNKLSPAAFAGELTDAVQVHRYSRAAPYSWITGERTPDAVMLRLISLVGSGWIKDWAAECLMALGKHPQ